MEAITVTEEQIRKMKHALGISHDTTYKQNYSVPNKRYRKKLVAYRNYYQIDNDSDWEYLMQNELADSFMSGKLNYYIVLDKGMEYLKSIGYDFKILR
jgi:hypothetical protein